MDIVNSMRMLTKVAELNRFARATELLDIAVPRISRVIADLEEHLGIRLPQRTTRKMPLTEAARIYLDPCRAISPPRTSIRARRPDTSRNTVRRVIRPIWQTIPISRFAPHKATTK